jgi:hypothetical protein
MSKQNVTGFFESIPAGGAEGIPDDPTPAQVIEIAGQGGFVFSQDELHSVMKDMIHTAQSLPRGWGWKLARTMKLVRET